MKIVLRERTSRNKLVNFRVSEDEASYLLEKADASGARSISEYVRVTALEMSKRDLGRRDPVLSIAHGHFGSASGEGEVSRRLLFVLRALEDALRAARREMVKD